MQLTVVTNVDTTQGLAYRLARVIYAETGAQTLRDVEALASMIKNLSQATSRSMDEIASDADMFESLQPTSLCHERLKVRADTSAFAMCLRVVQRMMRGNLPDCVMGATRFHRTELLPGWAINRGYIMDTGVLTFYL